MTPHREWFYEYEQYEGGYVFLGGLDNLDWEESD
jgi:hypothetical protein